MRCKRFAVGKSSGECPEGRLLSFSLPSMENFQTNVRRGRCKQFSNLWSLSFLMVEQSIEQSKSADNSQRHAFLTISQLLAFNCRRFTSEQAAKQGKGNCHANIFQRQNGLLDEKERVRRYIGWFGDGDILKNLQ
ncbi:hypothetical protein PoB_000477900 [Plakobranchus ocellatus]|uniref:Uncharacterized protein n=1 Tax=Plakobranchus ocellatus TaxID=259542 RepID=A0AAV3Y7N2_9GAST|nr:hypothetical protein PoB_000477900 [Plakobranchus ocellatus]